MAKTIWVTLQRTDRSPWWGLPLYVDGLFFKWVVQAPTGFFSSIFFFGNTLPETSSSHLKVDGWKITSLLKRSIFSGKLFVSGRVGMFDHTQRNVLSQASIKWFHWWISRRFFVYLKLALSTLRELRSQGMMFFLQNEEPKNPRILNITRVHQNNSSLELLIANPY